MQPFIDVWEDQTRFQADFILIADVRGDGQAKLVFFQESSKSLVVYKGVSRQHSTKLSAKTVTGLIKIPEAVSDAVAVFSEDCLYIYRGMLESYRLKIPLVSLPPEQVAAYGLQNSNKTFQALDKLRQTCALSQYSKSFMLSDGPKRAQMMEAYNRIQDSIVSVAVTKKGVVIGSENKLLYYLDSLCTRIIGQVLLPFVPQFIEGHEKQLVFGRFGELWVQGKMTLLPAKVVGTSKLGGDVLVAYDNKEFRLYSQSAAQLWRGTATGIITHVATLQTSSLLAAILCVQFRRIQIYNERVLVGAVVLKDRIRNMCFGSYGKEEGCLILTFEGKGFQVKILNRHFTLAGKYKPEVKGSEGRGPIPKATNFMLSQNSQEADNFRDMYALMQVQTIKLKTTLLRKKLHLQEEGGGSQNSPLKLGASIRGSNPFSLLVKVQNTSPKPVANIGLHLNFSPKHLEVEQPFRSIGFIPPLGQLELQFLIRRHSQSRDQMFLLAQHNGLQTTLLLVLPTII